ncbi:hypothetical protein [Halopseudomonas sp.]|uniref:hypothetical protein n=1 Tax=Halopseudomonas sp. TaxID=2901191 RepID=UPI0030022F74
MSDSYYFKSKSPAVVGIVTDYDRRLTEMRSQAVRFGLRFGGSAVTMVDLSRHFVGGIKISGLSDPSPHWTRPCDHGYRKLRSKAVIPKGTPKEQSAAIRAEHQRLIELWRDHYPPRVDRLDVWDQLGVNNGSVMMCGGVMFELNGTAYFHLGFPMNQTEDERKRAAKQPSYGWIEGAEELTATEYLAAREAKNQSMSEVPNE